MLKESSGLGTSDIPKSRYFLFKTENFRENTRTLYICKCKNISNNHDSLCNSCNSMFNDTFIILNFKNKIASLCLNNFVSSENIFRLKCCIYTDGISKFKYSKKTIWPIYLVSFDIKYPDRYILNNFVLLGIFYGNQKPNIQLLLFETLRDVFNAGHLVFNLYECTFSLISCI